jgi:hypothetical protein
MKPHKARNRRRKAIGRFARPCPELQILGPGFGSICMMLGLPALDVTSCPLDRATCPARGRAGLILRG